MTHQPGILLDPPPVARHLTFHLIPGEDPADALQELADAAGEDTVAGIGASTIAALGCSVAGMREPSALSGPGVSSPANPAGLWLWLRGDDRGELVHRTHTLAEAVADAFDLTTTVDAFIYADRRDLTGYKIGAGNPKDGAAAEAALVAGQGAGLDGGSFVAVQRWVHDLARLEDYDEDERDAFMGRARETDERIADAPASAHVKRVAQEGFSPPAYILRRSMPYSDPDEEGLLFVAFGRSFDAFEAHLRRMLGADDGVVDALFRFSEPLSTSYYWCPPVSGGRLDLSALGL